MHCLPYVILLMCWGLKLRSTWKKQPHYKTPNILLPGRRVKLTSYCTSPYLLLVICAFLLPTSYKTTDHLTSVSLMHAKSHTPKHTSPAQNLISLLQPNEIQWKRIIRMKIYGGKHVNTLKKICSLFQDWKTDSDLAPGPAAWEIIGDSWCDCDYWWERRWDGWPLLILTRLQQRRCWHKQQVWTCILVSIHGF